MKRVGIVVFLMAAMILFAGRDRLSQWRFSAGMKGKAAPSFELAALDGGRVRLSDFRGRPVVLAFWAMG